MKPMQYSSSVPAGSRQLNNHSSSGALLANESAEAPPYDTLIGRKVWTRWPEDNSFYEAIIKDYDHVKACLSLRNCSYVFALNLLFIFVPHILDIFFTHLTTSHRLSLVLPPTPKIMKEKMLLRANWLFRNILILCVDCPLFLQCYIFFSGPACFGL